MDGSDISIEQFGIGQPVKRREDQRFLTGAGHFTDDIDLPGQAWGYVLRSPHAHARILSIDTAAAKRAAGVLGVGQRPAVRLGPVAQRLLLPLPGRAVHHEAAPKQVMAIAE